jgi:hypothetical protein
MTEPIETFFNFLDEKTGGLIGIPETLLASSAIGCLFALFSCQPLVIVGELLESETRFLYSKSYKNLNVMI